MTWCSTALSHQMPLLWDTYDWMSAWPTGWPNVKMTLHCSILGHQMLYGRLHLIECQLDQKDDQMSRWPNIVLFLATRYLYGRLNLIECQLEPKDDQMSRWRDIVLFLNTRCLYWEYIWLNVSLNQRMTKWQDNLTLYHSWPPDAYTGGYIWLNVCLIQRMTKCQDDLT